METKLHYNANKFRTNYNFFGKKVKLILKIMLVLITILVNLFKIFLVRRFYLYFSNFVTTYRFCNMSTVPKKILCLRGILIFLYKYFKTSANRLQLTKLMTRVAIANRFFSYT